MRRQRVSRRKKRRKRRRKRRREERKKKSGHWGCVDACKVDGEASGLCVTACESDYYQCNDAVCQQGVITKYKETKGIEKKEEKKEEKKAEKGGKEEAKKEE